MKLNNNPPLILLLVFAAVPPLGAQTPPPALPYDASEFPLWSRDLRRAEIISFGSYPFTFFTATFLMDGIRFFQHDNDVRYAPWPFKPAGAFDTSNNEKALTMGVAAALSLTIALADFIIIHIKRARQKRAAEGRAAHTGNVEIGRTTEP